MCSFIDVLAAEIHRMTNRRRLCCQRQGDELLTACWLQLLLVCCVLSAARIVSLGGPQMCTIVTMMGRKEEELKRGEEIKDLFCKGKLTSY